METKNLLNVVIGAGVAYFGFKAYNDWKKKKAAAQAAAQAAAAAQANPRLVACQSQLDQLLPLLKVADVETFKTKYIAECMTRTLPQVSLPTDSAAASSTSTIPSVSSLSQGTGLLSLDTLFK